MMNFPLRLAGLAVLTAFAGLLLAGVWRGAAWLPPCFFHRLTGLDCPGCGMTRACADFLHGEIGRAFRHNPLGFVLAPLSLAAMAVMAWQWLLGRAVKAPFGQGWAKPLLLVICAFWILRNVPGFAFLGS